MTKKHDSECLLILKTLSQMHWDFTYFLPLISLLFFFAVVQGGEGSSSRVGLYGVWGFLFSFFFGLHKSVQC